jgi:hypothetical protein
VRRRREEEDDPRPRRRAAAREEDEEDDRPRPRRRDRSRDEDGDEEDEPRRREPPGTSGKATAAMILGLLSLCLGVVTAIPAVIFGVLGLRDIARSKGRLAGKGMALTGVIAGGVGTLLGIGSIIFFTFVYGEARARREDQTNLKHIGLAMHNYADTYSYLPDRGEPPDPMKLAEKPRLSWRVALLPYLEEDNLYRRFKLDEPWDSPHNKALLTPMPKVYAHPRDPQGAAQGLTPYRVFTGPNAPFERPKPRFPASFPDGTSNTFLVVEAADAVPWTKPDELAYDPARPLPKLGGRLHGGFNAVMGDAAVRFIPQSTPERTLRGLITSSGGEVVQFPP